MLQKRFFGGPPNCSLLSLHLSPSFLQVSATNGWCFRKSSLEGSPNCSSTPIRLPVSFGCLGQRAVASEKVLWRVPPTVFLYICLPVSNHLLRQMAGASEEVLWLPYITALLYNLSPSLSRFSGAKSCRFRKDSLEGSPNCSLHLSPSLLRLSRAVASENVFGGLPQLFSTFVPQSPTRLSVLCEFSTSLIIPLHLHSASLLEHSMGFFGRKLLGPRFQVAS